MAEVGNALIPGQGDLAVTLCDCLIVALESGQCNDFCSSSTCADRVERMINCTLTQCPEGSTCGSLITQATDICDGASAYVLEDPDFCNVQTANLNYLMDAMSLHEDVRQSCQGINDQIANDACQRACSAPTCATYLGELQVCAKVTAQFDCYFALNSLRYHVAGGWLDCQFFDEIDGACRVQHTTDSIANLTYTTFDELMPEEVRFILGDTTVDSCSCINSNIQNCSICDADSMCSAVNLTKSCAQDTSCGTECGEALEIVEKFLSVAGGCVVVDDQGTTNCSDTLNVTLNCDAFDTDLCTTRGDEVQDGDEVPIFGPIPSASFSASPSASPTISVSSSITPTISDSSSVTPTISLTPSITPSVSVSRSGAATLGFAAVISCVIFALFF